MSDEIEPSEDASEIVEDTQMECSQDASGETSRQARIDKLTEKAIEIVERAMDDDDPEFATQTALALLRIVKGGGIGGSPRKNPSNSRSGDGDDPTREVDVPDGDVWAGARGRFEGEHKQSGR